jgi:Isocitrate lyase family
MTAYSRLQEKEFLREQQAGYEAVKHQRFVGTGYFDAVQQVITSGAASTMALEGSTEEAQFSGAGNRSMEDSSLSGKQDPNHAITVPVAIVDPLTADPSLMATCWEASDELMPSGD